MEMSSGNDKIFEKDKFIIRQGESAQAAYLIKNGLVKVYRMEGDREIEVARLSSGEIFGEMALIEKRHHSMNVKTIIETEVALIRPETIHKKIRTADPLLRAILMSVMQRLTRMDQKKVREMLGEEEPEQEAKES